MQTFPENYLTLKSIAKTVGYSHQAVGRHIKKGWLKAEVFVFRSGGRCYGIKPIEFENYKKVLESRKKSGPRGVRKKIPSYHLTPQESPERYPHCKKYPDCLDKAARANVFIDCKKCENYKADPMWIVE